MRKLFDGFFDNEPQFIQLEERMTDTSKKAYYSDLITDYEIERLIQEKQTWALSGGTGSGKSTLISQIMGLHPDYTFYILSPRTKLVEQQRTDFKNMTDEEFIEILESTMTISRSNVEIMTIQSFMLDRVDSEGNPIPSIYDELSKKIRQHDKICIVIDEIQTLIDDSTFNPMDMQNLFDYLNKHRYEIPFVLMSAGGDLIFKELSNIFTDLITYDIKSDYSYVNSCISYASDCIEQAKILEYIKKDKKVVSFQYSYRDCLKIMKFLDQHGITYCFQMTKHYLAQLGKLIKEQNEYEMELELNRSNESRVEYVTKQLKRIGQKIENIKQCSAIFDTTENKKLFHRNRQGTGYTFDSQVLICTKVYDVGISIITDELNTDIGAIMVNQPNFSSAQQCFGRYRHQPQTNSKVDFYYRVFNESQLASSIYVTMKEATEDLSTLTDLKKLAIRSQNDFLHEIKQLAENEKQTTGNSNYNFFKWFVKVGQREMFRDCLEIQIIKRDSDCNSELLEFIKAHKGEWLDKQLQDRLKLILNRGCSKDKSKVNKNRALKSVSAINEYLSEQFNVQLTSKKRMVNSKREAYWIITEV